MTDEDAPAEVYLTSGDVRRLLGVHLSTVYRLVNQGKLPCIRDASNARRFRRADVEQFIAESRVNVEVDVGVPTEPVCPRCRHAWTDHNGRDGRTPDRPCCMHYLGMGEPCGCDALPGVASPLSPEPTTRKDGPMMIDYVNWDTRTCANALCGKPLNGSIEFVLQVSTKHVRWFCNVDCVVQGRDEHLDKIARRDWP